jgi:hypothetical protein
MLNIDSEPMATPITNPRRAKKLRSTSGASARDSTISSRTNAAAAHPRHRLARDLLAQHPAHVSRHCRSGSAGRATARADGTQGRRADSLRRRAGWTGFGLLATFRQHERADDGERCRPPRAAVHAARRPATPCDARHSGRGRHAPPSSGPMLKPSIRNPVQAPIAAPLRNPAPGKDVHGELDRTPGIRERPRPRATARLPSNVLLLWMNTGSSPRLLW